SLTQILSDQLWAEMFPQRNALYSFEGMLAAAAYYPAFAGAGDDATRRREVAAFLANISHETTGGWPAAPGGPHSWGLYFIQEVGCETGGCTGYCDASNVQYPCSPGRTYHGRGPMQLSWNYNYGQVGDVLGVDLLNNPDLVTTDAVTTFRTALWFWTTPQAPKPSAHDGMVGAWVPSAHDVSLGRQPGFGMTVNIINGGLECGNGAPNPGAVTDRLGFYDRYTTLLGTTPGSNLTCDSMAHY